MKDARQSAIRNQRRSREGRFHGQFSPFLVDVTAGMLPIHLLVERTQHGATLSPQLFLKPLVQMSRQMTDASKPGAHGCAAPVQYAQNEDAGRQGPAHAASGNSFHPFLVGFHTSPAPMKAGGYLGRGRFDFQFQHRRDRGEDRLASMVALLPILFGQPAGFLREGGDPAGRDNIARWRRSSEVFYF